MSVIKRLAREILGDSGDVRDEDPVEAPRGGKVLMPIPGTGDNLAVSRWRGRCESGEVYSCGCVKKTMLNGDVVWSHCDCDHYAANGAPIVAKGKTIVLPAQIDHGGER